MPTLSYRPEQETGANSTLLSSAFIKTFQSGRSGGTLDEQTLQTDPLHHCFSCTQEASWSPSHQLSWGEDGEQSARVPSSSQFTITPPGNLEFSISLLCSLSLWEEAVASGRTRTHADTVRTCTVGDEPTTRSLLSAPLGKKTTWQEGQSEARAQKQPRWVVFLCSPLALQSCNNINFQKQFSSRLQAQSEGLQQPEALGNTRQHFQRKRNFHYSHEKYAMTFLF